MSFLYMKVINLMDLIEVISSVGHLVAGRVLLIGLSKHQLFSYMEIVMSLLVGERLMDMQSGRLDSEA